jgi:hypothetical protein
MFASNRITVSDAEFLARLPLDQMSFYTSILSGIGDRATELRYEGKDEYGLAKALLNVGGNIIELTPTSREEVEREIRSLLPPLERVIKTPIYALINGCYEARLTVEVKGKETDVLVSAQPEVLIIRFLNPDNAADEAFQLSEEFRDLPERAFRQEEI